MSLQKIKQQLKKLEAEIESFEHGKMNRRRYEAACSRYNALLLKQAKLGG